MGGKFRSQLGHLGRGIPGGSKGKPYADCSPTRRTKEWMGLVRLPQAEGAALDPRDVRDLALGATERQGHGERFLPVGAIEELHDSRPEPGP